MGMSCANPKKNSKRKPLKLKFTIKKKVLAKTKKIRKLAKTHGALRKSRRRDPGIPNSFPLKAVLLDEVAKAKVADRLKKAEQRRALRETRMQTATTTEENVGGIAEVQKRRDAERQDTYDFSEMREAIGRGSRKPVVGAASLEELAAAASNAVEGLPNGEIDEGDVTSNKASVGSRYFRELSKIIQQADVLLFVLDARDPNGCRCPKVERWILSLGKKVVFVLNKIDLVPTDIVRQWLVYLRRVAPTVAFKSLIAHNASAGTRAKLSKVDPLSSSQKQLSSNTQVLGAGILMCLLNNYSRIEGPTGATKGPLTVGIVGYPNVGKSSIINSLKRSASAVRVGGEAGVTRTLQEVQLDKRIKLIDSPGVIFSGDETVDTSNILRNAVKISSVEDPVAVVDAIVSRTPAELLMRIFRVPMFASTNEFIAHVARARGRIGKGAVPHIAAAAQAILMEWTSGKLRHYCTPPRAEEEQEQMNGVSESSAVVSTFSTALDIDELWKQNDCEVETAAEPQHSDEGVKFVVPMASGPSGVIHSDGDVSMVSSAGTASYPKGRNWNNDSSLPTGLLQVEAGSVKPQQAYSESKDTTQIRRKRRRALQVEEAERKQRRQRTAAEEETPLRTSDPPKHKKKAKPILRMITGDEDDL